MEMKWNEIVYYCEVEMSFGNINQSPSTKTLQPDFLTTAHQQQPDSEIYLSLSSNSYSLYCLRQLKLTWPSTLCHPLPSCHCLYSCFLRCISKISQTPRSNGCNNALLARGNLPVDALDPRHRGQSVVITDVADPNRFRVSEDSPKIGYWALLVNTESYC